MHDKNAYEYAVLLLYQRDLVQNIIKIEMLQKNKNTKYNIDNYVCTGMNCANLKCK